MTTTRRIGAIAALGGMMTAAAALMVGLPSAQADELSQLQANQALLQQKLNQLEQQAAAPPAAPLPPGAASLAGSFPRSILIPGTNTSMEIGGFVQLDATYWFTNGNPNDTSGAAPPLEGAPVIAGIALRKMGPGVLSASPFNGRSRAVGIFRMQADESRFFIETRTPTSYGEAITHLELDLFGCAGAGGIDCSELDNGTNGNVPRLRLAYGALGPFLAGQDWGPTLDLDSSPTIFDFGGDVGIMGPGRGPQIRYTAQLPYGQSLIIAAYQPETGVFSPLGGFGSDSVLASVNLNGTGLNSAGTQGLAVNPGKTRLPDGQFVWRLERPWGNVQVGTFLRDLTLADGRFVNKDFLGYGGQVGVHMVPFPNSRDNLGLNAFAGNGLGHYASPTGNSENTFWGLASNYGGAAVGGYGTCNSATPACFAINSKANADRVIAKTITSWGAEANYQHWWKFAPGWRSTISAGIAHQDVPTTLVGLSGATVNFNKELISGHLNLMWSPVAFINTGVELIYGHRKTIWKQTGNEEVIDYTFRVTF